LESIQGRLIYKNNLKDNLAVFRFEHLDHSPIDDI